jgi:hypothetical protein
LAVITALDALIEANLYQGSLAAFAASKPKLRFLLRLAADLRLLAARALDGRLIGGWTKMG